MRLPGIIVRRGRRFPVRPALYVAFLCTLAFAESSAAVDGVIEINHAIAGTGGINGSTTSDPPGYPVVITQPGSYRLTSDLRPGFQTGIRIDASEVSIDLNHFTIRGSWTLLAICGSGDTGVGVLADATRKAISVSNGRVRGMSVHGIVLLGDLARVESIAAFDNCVTGVFVGRSAHVSDTQSTGNLGHGIVTDAGSIVVRSIGSRNSLHGILGNGPGVYISDSTAEGNSQRGIWAVSDGAVARSISRSNGSFGITADLIVESVANAGTGTALVGAVAHSVAVSGSVSVDYLGCILLGGLKVCE
jgi:hypothetical protein